VSLEQLELRDFQQALSELLFANVLGADRIFRSAGS
jgi:hypothetical protein